MAANQTSKHKSGNHKKHASQFARSAETGEREEASTTYGEMAEQASDYVAEAAEETQECIRNHTGAAVMVSLVAGFGIGLLVGKAIGTSRTEPKSRRYRAMAEGFGSRLMERIEAMVPDALAEHFHK